jgi:hypothetical protein
MLLWRKLFPLSREREWARSILPQPYSPTTTYEGIAADDWQKRMDMLPNYLHYENFDSDKNDRALKLTPRSPRVQYGLDLTRGLLKEIEYLAAANGTRFTIFTTTRNTQLKGYAEEPDEVVHLLNGKYYRTSEAQYIENLNYVNKGFDSYSIPVTVEPSIVGPEDSHLNEHATDQVIKDLAAKIESLVSRPSRVK